MAPILGPDGQPLAARGWHDAESIADDGGTLYVGIEGVNQIVQFDYGCRFGGSGSETPSPVRSSMVRSCSTQICVLKSITWKVSPYTRLRLEKSS
jgi:hypothetical protein